MAVQSQLPELSVRDGLVGTLQLQQVKMFRWNTGRTGRQALMVGVHPSGQAGLLKLTPMEP